MSEALPPLDALRHDLCKANQSHLFGPESRYAVETQQQWLQELQAFSYPGGVLRYLSNARSLLESSRSCVTNEFVALEQPPLVYHAPTPLSPSQELHQLLDIGTALLPTTVYVLVAGGLGERLGYSGIKIGLPMDTASSVTYLEHFLASFVKPRLKDEGRVRPSFVLMTSDDTHSRTEAMLQSLLDRDDGATHYGKDVICVKQGTVPCLSDNDARLAVDKGEKLARKPHGHGDVHRLLFEASVDGRPLLDHWHAAGVTGIVFCQDTNAMSTWTSLVTLGISKRENLAMNFTCVPRVPQEAIGLLCHATPATQSGDVSVARTVNVEYNKFEPIYKSLYGKGDVPQHDSIFSPFPGSINTLVFEYQAYRDVVSRSSGEVPEFINPKYVDSTKTAFKAPTRVESLMQDIALLFDPARHRVGGTVFDRETYHPVKNSLAEAIAKVRVGADAHCAASGEAHEYQWRRDMLSSIGVDITRDSHNGDGDDFVILRIPSDSTTTIPVRLFPIVSFDNVFHQNNVYTVASRFPNPSLVSISNRSALVIRGNVVIESLRLDGALVIDAGDGVEPLVVRDVVVINKGWSSKCVGEESDNEVDVMRGFVLRRTETEVIGQSSHLSKM